MSSIGKLKKKIARNEDRSSYWNGEDSSYTYKGKILHEEDAHNSSDTVRRLSKKLAMKKALEKKSGKKTGIISKLKELSHYEL